MTTEQEISTMKSYSELTPEERAGLQDRDAIACDICHAEGSWRVPVASPPGIFMTITFEKNGYLPIGPSRDLPLDKSLPRLYICANCKKSRYEEERRSRYRSGALAVFLDRLEAQLVAE